MVILYYTIIKSPKKGLIVPHIGHLDILDHLDPTCGYDEMLCKSRTGYQTDPVHMCVRGVPYRSYRSVRFVKKKRFLWSRMLDREMRIMFDLSDV